LSLVPVARTGRPTKDKQQAPPSTERFRAKRSASDGSVVGRLVSLDHFMDVDEHSDRFAVDDSLAGYHAMSGQ
jgi:hypothetical protein